MSKLTWDNSTERLYETGVQDVALYPMTGTGAYGKGVAWNGITALNLTPSGGEPTPLYANNKKYITLMSVEELGGTIEAYMYPDEWAACNGSVEAADGMYIGQQARIGFGLVAKTIIGNDTEQNKHGFKLHIIYNALASPSETAYATINDSPEVDPMSWEFTTTPVESVVNNVNYSTSHICIDSTKFAAAENGGLNANLQALLDTLYGTTNTEPELPSPADVYALVTTGQKASQAAG